MRKTAVLLLLALLSLPIAAEPSFGYSLAPVGSFMESRSYGALTLSAIFSPDKELHAGDVELSVDISPVFPFFEGASLKVSTPLFQTTGHPFGWAFANTVLWAPSVNVGVRYRPDNEWDAVVGCAPFAFEDTQFIYEFFSPYAVYSLTEESWGWGMYVLRFSYFF